MSTCPECGAPTASTQAVIDGRARYADTQGGHNDRHTLVIEATERASGAFPTPRPNPGRDG